MKISDAGLKFIKAFEGCDLTAVKYEGEKFYTIGYGHYGADVHQGDTITEEAAAELLRKDLESYYPSGIQTQAYFDSLTSYWYNCGTGSSTIWKLRNRKVRNGLNEVLAGLVRRRKSECILSFTGEYITTMNPITSYLKKKETMPETSIRDYNAFETMLIQWAVGAEPDGIFGEITRAMVKDFQNSKGIAADGIVGPITWGEIKKLKF